MSFDAAWLDLREPADRAARDPELLALAAAWLRDGAAVDLGSGTGSTLRAFGGRAPGARWRLVDHDAGLLECAAARCPDASTTVAELSDLEALPLDGARLVTASALCDLVSHDWIVALAERLAALGAAFYAALSYDGAMRWTPGLPGDAAATKAFNRHQRGDKGLGPALGPDAGAAVAAAFERLGFAVRTAPSPWRLGPSDAELQRELVTGIASAAGEAGFAKSVAWGQARRALSETAGCVVGHWDLLALPGAPRAQSKTTSEPSP